MIEVAAVGQTKLTRHCVEYHIFLVLCLECSRYMYASTNALVSKKGLT